MSWFDEQGIPGGSIAPIESGYQPGGGGWGGGRVLTDEERERMRQELMTRTGGQWGGEPGGGAKIPTMDVRTGDMHNPGWGIERGGGMPIDAPAAPEWNEYLRNNPAPPTTSDDSLYTMPDGSKVPYIPPLDPWRHRGGIEAPASPPPPAVTPYMPPPQGGTLGAVGMGQPQSFGQRIMAGNGGRNALSGAFGGMFGGAGTPTSALGFGQAPTAALQSVSGYGGGRQLGGFAGGGGSMLRSPTGVSRQVARSDVPFYLQRGATEVR